jgi:hypothetical protein
VTGIQVFDATDQYLGTISVPRQPANAAFAGPSTKSVENYFVGRSSQVVYRHYNQLKNLKIISQRSFSKVIVDYSGSKSRKQQVGASPCGNHGMA